MKHLMILLLVGTACAHATAPEATTDAAIDQDRATAAALQERADALEQALFSPGVERKEPDCTRACGLVDQICELGSRICAISGRHVGDEDLLNRCAAATQRCERSRDRASSRCACPSR
jgi:hypothetical protein